MNYPQQFSLCYLTYCSDTPNIVTKTSISKSTKNSSQIKSNIVENITNEIKSQSIIIESDNETWNYDSTGSRYLVWVWYRESAEADYRCLNLEILQNAAKLPASQ